MDADLEAAPCGKRGLGHRFSDHLGMTRAPAFTDNVLYILLEDPR